MFLLVISLDRYTGSWNSLDDSFAKICVSNKTKDVNVKVFNIITKLNEEKTLLKHISCDYKCKFDQTKCNSNRKCNGISFYFSKMYHIWKNNFEGKLVHLIVRKVCI